MKVFYLLTCCVFFQSLIQPGYSSLRLNTDNWQVAHYGKDTFESFNHTGYVSLDGTKVLNQTTINGYLQARFAGFHDLLVIGHVKIEDSWVYHKTNIEGGLFAINVQFSKLTCRSSKVLLSHCRVSDLLIQIPEDEEEQYVILCDGTEISGDVIFESGKGTILASEDSIPKVVRGGRIEVKNISKKYQSTHLEDDIK